MLQQPAKLGYRTTAAEGLCGRDLSGVNVVITGGNAGLGLETVKSFAAAGASVALCCRSVSAGLAAVDSLQPIKGSSTVHQLDLASVKSVAAAAADLAASLDRIDILICNAGCMALRPRQETEDGFEKQLGVNYLGHHLLIKLLLPKMRQQGGAPARVVVLSSSAHKFGSIGLEDLNYSQRTYRPWLCYGQSKLACALFARELAKREAGVVEAFAVHPGVVETSIGAHFGARARIFYGLFGSFLKTKEQGVATAVYAATSAELRDHSGAYLADCAVTTPSKRAQDDAMAAALWNKSEQMLAEALAKAGVPDASKGGSVSSK